MTPIAELRRLLGMQVKYDALRGATSLYESGRFEQAALLLAEALTTYGEDGALLYDLSCFEALSDDGVSALRHLRRALELAPHLRGAARVDSDLASLAGDPRFSEIVEEAS